MASKGRHENTMYHDAYTLKLRCMSSLWEKQASISAAVTGSKLVGNVLQLARGRHIIVGFGLKGSTGNS
jgi:hypothetical protein